MKFKPLLKYGLIEAILIFSRLVLASEHSPPPNWTKAIQTGSLQEKVNRAVSDGVLELPPGEHLGPIVIDTPNMVVDGKNHATVNGQGKGSVIVVRASGVTIKNLKIINGGTSYIQGDAGIALINNSGAKILNNKITDCLFGIDVYAGDDITIKNNFISSRNLDIGLRGDAIRLWSVQNSRVEENEWQYSRDVVAWYSSNIKFRKNKGSYSRYSLHSMYSKNLYIHENYFYSNSVGIFLMYGQDFQVTKNRIERSQGATGMGLGVKEASNVLAQHNEFIYCAVGIMVDGSPFKLGSRNWFSKNKIAFNSKGILLNNDLPGGEFKKNVFVGNAIDVDTEHRGGGRGKWLSNIWDKYLGFDQNQDGVGDTPFIIKKYGDRIKSKNLDSSFFYGTFVYGLITFIEEVAYIGDPAIILSDSEPILFHTESPEDFSII